MRSYNPHPNTECKSSNTQIAYKLLPALVHFVLGWVWANPRSLVATQGISFDFYSSGY